MASLPSILVVDDDPETRELVRLALPPDQFRLTFAEDGNQALGLFFNRPFDLVLLDRILPDLDGLEVCRRIRQISGVPIIILTACTGEDDLLDGFTAGAFDYLVKPFRFRELAVRIISLRQHCSFQLPPEGHELIYQGLLVNPEIRQVVRDGQVFSISPNGFQLLVYFMKNIGRPVSKKELLCNVWGYDETPGDINLVEAAVTRLRRELGENPLDPRYIKTIRGAGYQFGEA